MLTCAATNYTFTFLMIISKLSAPAFKQQHGLRHAAALMVIKGGDVEQLIETPYAQPYIQIVSSQSLAVRQLKH